MRANKKGNAHASARANITRAAYWSTLATFRNIPARTMARPLMASAATFLNNQQIAASHNAIVIMQNHKQRKRDNANNKSVIITIASSRHNGIVISRSRAQAFVTKRNISSAYLLHKLGLSLTSGSPDTNTHHDHAPIRIRMRITR
jgi:hypothetical protein